MWDIVYVICIGIMCMIYVDALFTNTDVSELTQKQKVCAFVFAIAAGIIAIM